MVKDRILAAYVADGTFHRVPLTEDAVSKLTHINYAFGVVQEDRVVTSHLKNLQHLVELKKKTPHLKTVLSIGGWGAGGFSEAASTLRGREVFAETAVQCMLQYNFDGIDIDWEYPGIGSAGIAFSASDRDNYSLLLLSIRERLKKETGSYLLTMAAGAHQTCLDHLDIPLLMGEYLDFMNIMTYDMWTYGPRTGHHTSLYPSEVYPEGYSAHKSIELYHRAGLPLSRTVLGAAFYGRSWIGVDPNQNGLYQPAEKQDRTYDYSEILPMLADPSWVQHFDPTAKAPYLFNGSTFISYDDPLSIAHKTAYIKERDLLGLMFWEYSTDNSGTLLASAYRGLFG